MPEKNEAVKETVEDDSITCNGCGTKVNREAPEGVQLQRTSNFVCENCQEKHNEDSGANKAEVERIAAEQEFKDEPVKEPTPAS